MNFNLTQYFEDCRILVNGALEKCLSFKEAFPEKLHEAMHYSLLADGKRIRPILCLAAAEACGGGRNEVLPVACALEMIHTFSLIHDDLPAMDDDDLRRGQPTSHKVFGEGIAILAGDALFSQAFVVLAKLKDSHPEPHRVLEVICDIAEATGAPGMIGGQVMDLESEGKKVALAELKRLHTLKTGRLITVSVTSGAKLVCDDTQKWDALEHYGEKVGLAFQIADDILDLEGGEEIGKDVGSDLNNKKATYPALMGLPKAKKEGMAACDEAIGALHSFGPEGDALRTIARFIVERKK